ncbi:MAG: hypothetical protein WD042_12255 [Phycisphaeraceae bacterium]
MIRLARFIALATVALGTLLALWTLPALRADDAATKKGKQFILNVGGTEDANGGAITGKVIFEGARKDPPKSRWIMMNSDKYCAGLHDNQPVRPETYIFGKAQDDTHAALVNVFVYVSKGLEGKTFAAPKAAAEMDQEGCMYTPHLRGVMVGQDFKILNSDATLHNVKLNSKNNGAFNEGMPVQGMEIVKKFDKVEMPMEFKCDVHAWMNAHVFVMAHPFYAVTQEDGSFTIKGLSPGKYTLSVWHEFDKFKAVKNDVEVTVEAGKTAEGVDFTFVPPGAK